MIYIVNLRNSKWWSPISSKSFQSIQIRKKELKFLEDQYEKDPKWSRKTVQIWKKALNLRTDQIYKWGYDRKKKNVQQKENDEDFLELDREPNLLNESTHNDISDLSSLVPKIKYIFNIIKLNLLTLIRKFWTYLMIFLEKIID